jgi:HSP20 family protein
MNIIRRNRPSGVSFPSLLDDFFNEPFLMVAPMGQQSLALDVSETEKDVVVRASLPGFTRDQVSVDVHNDVLTISAQREDESEEKGERFHVRERRFGSASRAVTLPAPVNDDKAKAELKDGVLTLTIPKHEKAMPRRISVQ